MVNCMDIYTYTYMYIYMQGVPQQATSILIDYFYEFKVNFFK